MKDVNMVVFGDAEKYTGGMNRVFVGLVVSTVGLMLTYSGFGQALRNSDLFHIEKGSHADHFFNEVYKESMKKKK